MNHINIDSYGSCLHNKDLKVKESNETSRIDSLDLLSKYKFVLVMEDAICNDYIGKELWKVSNHQIKLLGCIKIKYFST